MRRFVRDDAGYVAWLATHADGYVLNTYAHVTSAYLILHRARCRTVNRPLAPGRSWTYAYGKACSDDRAELEAWALRETGKGVEPCGHCLAGATGRAAPQARVAAGVLRLGPRAPRPITDPIHFTGAPIAISVRRGRDDHAPRLVIEGAQWLAETFFQSDPSAVGPRSYDRWIAGTQGNPLERDRLLDADVTAVNATMAARTSHATWAPLIASTDWTWLEALDPAWDLFATPEDDTGWPTMAGRLEHAFRVTRRPGLHLAVITKVLHIKRPNLIPVMDSVVADQVGARISDDPATWVEAIGLVRDVGRANLAELRAIESHLAAKGLGGRSLVRILDALLWVSSPGSGLFSSLAGWERVVRPRTEAE